MVSHIKIINPDLLTPDQIEMYNTNPTSETIIKMNAENDLSDDQNLLLLMLHMFGEKEINLDLYQLIKNIDFDLTQRFSFPINIFVQGTLTILELAAAMKNFDLLKFLLKNDDTDHTTSVKSVFVEIRGIDFNDTLMTIFELGVIPLVIVSEMDDEEDPETVFQFQDDDEVKKRISILRDIGEISAQLTSRTLTILMV
jgi:hypothetical protein